MQEKKSDFYVTDGENGFAELYRKMYAEIYRYVYRRIFNVQTAEDIVQETFYAAYIKYPEILTCEEAGKWLRRIAKYKMLELHRRMRYRSTVPLEEEAGLGREELCYRIKELELTALTVLSKEEWRLVRAYYLYGITIPELAASEGISEGNMRVRICRMKKKLKK